MDEKQAKRLGSFLRKTRESLGMSARQLAERCGLPHTTVTRIEEGAFSAPSPDKLSRIAEVLKLPLADVYALAEYAVPADMPSPTLYLRTKFREMPERELARVSREVEDVLKHYGINPSASPQPGEDEDDRDAAPKKKSNPRKKGGKR